MKALMAVAAVVVLGISAACSGSGGGGTSSPTATPTPTVSNTPTFSLTVAIAGPGSVASAPAGIACPGACAGSFGQGSQVTLTSTSSSGAAFQRWFDVSCSTNATCAFTLQTNLSLAALFHCDPVSSSGCATTDSCRFVSYRGEQTADCSTAGAGGEAAACSTDADCARGFSCAVGLGCHHNCYIGGGCSPGTSTCTSFNPPEIIRSIEYGVCL